MRPGDLPPVTVRDALARRTVPELRALAGLIGHPRLQRKAELVDVLDQFLRDPANLRSELERMDEVERAAVAEAARDLDGRLQLARFRARYGRVPGPGSTSRLGLLFLGPHGEIPADLCSRLLALTAEPPPAVLPSSPDLPEPGPDSDPLEVRMTERAAAADLAAMLRLCQAGKLRCSDKTKRPTAATTKLVAESLEGGEFYGGAHGAIASFAWPLLLQAGGLAELAGPRLQLTTRGRAALAARPHETIRHLWRRWVKQAPLDEFNRVDQIKGQASRGALTAAGPRRQIVADALASCPVSHWVQADVLFRFMRATDLDPQVARDPWKLYLSDPQYGSLGYDGYHDWTLLQGRYVLCLLLEYAAPLGLVDVAHTDPAGARDDYYDNWGADSLEALSRYDGLRYVRLTGLGAYALGLDDDYRPATQPATAVAAGPLRVLPNLEVVAVASLPVADAMVLETYAERTGDAVWTLRRDRYLAAIASGSSDDEIVRFLGARSHADLPATVTAFFQDAAANTRRLRDLGPARVIECQDPALAALIAADRRLGKLSWQCGERHLIVPAAAEAKFRRGLHDLGYALPLPDQDAHGGTPQ
jgi:hypothetical protein